MTIPLLFLALVTCVAGFIPFGHFVTASGLSYTIHLDWAVAATSICIAVIGIAVATWLYLSPNDKPARMAQSMSSLYRWAYHRFYIDEVYMFVTHKIIFRYISTPIAWFDRHVVERDDESHGYTSSPVWPAYHTPASAIGTSGNLSCCSSSCWAP